MHARYSPPHAAVILLVTVCVACSSPDGPTAPPGGGAPSDTLRVSELDVPSGETRQYAPGTVILSDGDVTIEGEILVVGDEPGDLTIICLAGEMRVAGTIRADAPSPRSSARRGDSGTDGILPKGRSIVLETPHPERSHLTFGIGARVASGDGRDADPLTVTFGDGLIEAIDGSDAGDIIVTTYGGTITFPEELDPGSPPMFELGHGGRGADATISRESYTTDGTSLHVIAGRGGDSGRLVFEAGEIINRPPVEAQIVLIVGGAAGDGGNAVWDNSHDGMLVGSTGVVERTFSLEQIVLEGGRGGDGATVGGNGGHAAYFSLRTITDRGDEVASANAQGGDGGDVFASPLPILGAIGGDGGGFVVLGNNGWHAASPEEGGAADGADGGAAHGRGGDGGDVREGVTTLDAYGGAGGNSAHAQTALVAAIPVAGASNYLDLFYGVHGGVGGNGRSRCDGCPGGNGGNNGLVSAVGGNGGDVLAVPHAFGEGGRGGNIWATRSASCGDGGDGNPPGQGGGTSAPTLVPGEGGSGPSAGASGSILVEPQTTGDGFAGATCGGESGSCDPDDDPEIACGEDGAIFSASYELIQGAVGDYFHTEVTMNLTAYKAWPFPVVASSEYKRLVTSEGEVVQDTTREMTGYETQALIELSARPFCARDGDGEIQWPDEGPVIVEEIGNRVTTVYLSGCNPFYWDPEYRALFYCCQRTAGDPDAWSVCGLPGRHVENVSWRAMPPDRADR